MCTCPTCDRSKKFKSIVGNITNEDDKKFLSEIYTVLLNVEAELEYYEWCKKWRN